MSPEEIHILLNHYALEEKGYYPYSMSYTISLIFNLCHKLYKWGNYILDKPKHQLWANT